jgi:hypothetical protein
MLIGCNRNGLSRLGFRCYKLKTPDFGYLHSFGVDNHIISWSFSSEPWYGNQDFAYSNNKRKITLFILNSNNIILVVWLILFEQQRRSLIL